jgi:hypothetical protein
VLAVQRRQAARLGGGAVEARGKCDGAPVPIRSAGRALRLAAAFSPAAVTGWLAWRHAVNVPVWDDWLRAPLAAAWHDGTFGLGDLYAPHIDHRIVLPRLMMLANLALTGGDLRFEMGVTFAVALAGAAALCARLHRTLPAGAAAATFVANLFLFSPLQWENFLWAIQTAFVIPLACLSLALLALASPLSPHARFALDPALGSGRVRLVHAEVREGRLRLRGRAEAHGVLVTHGEASDAPRVVGIGELRTRTPPRAERQDHLFNAPERRAAPHDRWHVEILLAALPDVPEIRLELWAVDAAAMRAGRAMQHVELRRSADGSVASIVR